jgi:hypothetical protein
MPPKDQNFGKTILWHPYVPTEDKYNLMTYYAVQILVANDLFPISKVEIYIGAMFVVIGTLVVGIRIGEISNLL